MSNVIDFKRPDPPRENRLLYEVNIYEHATHFFDPNNDEINQTEANAALLDATFHVYSETDECHLLFMLGNVRSDSIRMPHSFDTPAQRAWFRRRLDDLYTQVTGEERGAIRRFRAFLLRLFHFKETNDDHPDHAQA